MRFFSQSLLASTLVTFVAPMAFGAAQPMNDPDNKYVPDAVADVNVGYLNSIPLITSIEKPRADEEKIKRDLITIFDGFVAKNRSADGTLHRGTHAKGKCFDAQVHVYSQNELETEFKDSPELAARLKRGLFASDKTFPAVVRFANADGFGRIQSDTQADVRGFSFSMGSDLQDFSGGHRQDFMFNSAPMFITPDIKEFYELVAFAEKFQVKSLKEEDRPKFNPAYLPLILGDVANKFAGNENGRNTLSFAKTEYWTNLPYTHGLDASGKPLDIVKYKAVPCDGKGTQRLTSVKGLADDYLQKDIVGRAQRGEVCMMIQMQFFDAKKLRLHALTPSAMGKSVGRSLEQVTWSTTDFVENGGSYWDDELLPYHTVAKLEIPAGSNNEVDCSEQYINSRIHASVQNLPVGSIARVRTYIEEISRFHRMNSEPRH